MSFSRVLKVKKSFRSWVTHLLGPQKKTQPCHGFAKSTLPLCSQQQKWWYNISLSSECRPLPALYFPMNPAAGANRCAHAGRALRGSGSCRASLSSPRLARDPQCSLSHPGEVIALPTSLLLSSWDRALVWVAGFAFPTLRLNSFQAKKKGQMGIFRYYNTCFLSDNSRTWEPRKVKFKLRACISSQVRVL